MVEWLREVGMPADYVNKLARMFQDIKVSPCQQQEYNDNGYNKCIFFYRLAKISMHNFVLLLPVMTPLILR